MLFRVQCQKLPPIVRTLIYGGAHLPVVTLRQADSFLTQSGRRIPSTLLKSGLVHSTFSYAYSHFGRAGIGVAKYAVHYFYLE
jgi:hypothetical protein